jgi:hypothetical protein
LFLGVLFNVTLNNRRFAVNWKFSAWKKGTQNERIMDSAISTNVWSIPKEMLTYKLMGRTEVECSRKKQDNSETEREVYVVGAVAIV